MIKVNDGIACSHTHRLTRKMAAKHQQFSSKIRAQQLNKLASPLKQQSEHNEKKVEHRSFPTSALRLLRLLPCQYAGGPHINFHILPGKQKCLHNWTTDNIKSDLHSKTHKQSLVLLKLLRACNDLRRLAKTFTLLQLPNQFHPYPTNQECEA